MLARSQLRGITIPDKQNRSSKSLCHPFQNILAEDECGSQPSLAEFFSFLQRTGPGLLSVLWPRLASIQGLHLHQSDTKPHGPPQDCVSSRGSNCDRFVLPQKKNASETFHLALSSSVSRHVDPFNAAERCRMNPHAPVAQTFLSELRFLRGESFTDRYDGTSSRPKDSIILEIQSELLFRNSPRLISAWH